MLKQSLQLKLLQKLSPQQIQVIKLLEIPVAQLEQRIKKELEENPALEEGSIKEDNFEKVSNDSNDNMTIDDYVKSEVIPSYKLKTHNYSEENEKTEIPVADKTTLYEHLVNQLDLLSIEESEKQIAEYIIGNIDEDGYLRRDIEAIVDDLAFLYNISVQERNVLEVLRYIQDLEPAGVGARDLRECLTIQIEKKGKFNPDVKNAYNILRHHYNSFTKKHFEKISKSLGLNEEDMKCAIDEILSLNPKPGISYTSASKSNLISIIPDFIVDVVDNEIILSLNERNTPELRVNSTYTEMLKDLKKSRKEKNKSETSAAGFVKQKIDSANWFIDALRQRHETLLLVMNAIIDLQRDYFFDGDEAKLKPMILKDISKVTDLDVSTISRVTNSKYVQTHFGIYSLKYFFSESMQTNTGEEVSTREIKVILKEIIDNENKKKPLTDEKLVALLKEKNYSIARRTVAKYREQLNIPVARLRKEL